MPDDVVRQAYYKVRRDPLDEFPPGVRETVSDILERGKELQIQMLHEIREARQTKKAGEIAKLHRDCLKQPRVILGQRLKSGRILESNYSFCKLVGASKGGRKLVLQEFSKQRCKCMFSGSFDFGAVYPGVRGNFYRKAKLDLHLVRTTWQEKVGKPFKQSCAIFQRTREHCQPMGAEYWPWQYRCAIREEQLEKRTMQRAIYPVCESGSGSGVAVKTMISGHLYRYIFCSNASNT
jgi:hypothetical protein